MHLLIFDPHERGHYLSYVRHLLPEASDLATQTTLVLRRDITSGAAYAEQLEGAIPETVAIDEAIDSESYARGRSLWRDFVAACERHRPDHVWIPSADLLVRQGALAALAVPWTRQRWRDVECGLVELRFHRPPKHLRGRVRQFAERTLLRVRPWMLHTIDPTAFTWTKRHVPGLSQRLDVIPDPVDDVEPLEKMEARRSLGLPERGRYVGSVGAHAIPRKGTGLLVAAFARSRLGREDRLLLAGSLGSALQDQLRTEHASLLRDGRIVVVDKYLGNQELNRAIAAMDVVCTPYVGHLGSSGVALHAAKLGRFVLAPHQGWFADIVPSFGLGHTGDILDVNRLAFALPQALEASTSFQQSDACSRLMEYSTARNFAAHWARQLRRRMNHAEPDYVRTWEWVTAALPAESPLVLR